MQELLMENNQLKDNLSAKLSKETCDVKTQTFSSNLKLNRGVLNMQIKGHKSYQILIEN